MELRCQVFNLLIAGQYYVNILVSPLPGTSYLVHAIQVSVKKNYLKEYCLSLRHHLFTDVTQILESLLWLATQEWQRQHEHTIPNFIETYITLVSKDDIFAIENQIAVLNVFISDFSLHTDLIFPFFIFIL